MVAIEKWKPPVSAMLQALGFFEKFGFRTSFKRDGDAGRIRILPMRSGHSADSLAVDQLLKDLKALYPLTEEDSKESLIHLYGAMIEAMVNVVSHAYPDDGKFPYDPIERWWMTGAVDQDRRWTTAMVFDQGITIPVSLPNWRHYGGVRQRLISRLGLAPAPDDTKSDGMAIAAAVAESVSSTGEPHRGRGLAQMRGFVDRCKAGYLRIISRCGEVVMQPGEDPVVQSYLSSIDGTLIEWNVLL